MDVQSCIAQGPTNTTPLTELEVRCLGIYVGSTFFDTRLHDATISQLYVGGAAADKMSTWPDDG